MCSKAKRHFSDGEKEPQTLVGESWAKFVDLWRCGKSATFHIECRNGNARLHFSTLLGRPEDLNKMADSAKSTLFPTTTKVNSPKKQSPSKLKQNQLRLQTFLAKKRRESSDDATEPESVNGQVLPDEKVRQETCSDFTGKSDLNESSPHVAARYVDRPDEKVRQESCSDSSGKSEERKQLRSQALFEDLNKMATAQGRAMY